MLLEAYLGLGSNTGDRQKNIVSALNLFAERVGDVFAFSHVYETLPWGYESDCKYMNAAVKIYTSLPPHDLLRVTQVIERKLGRKEKTFAGQYKDRPIDIDILMYDDLTIETPTLKIPHPLMHQRLFVLQPLAEIAPDKRHPVLGQTISELLLKLTSLKQP